MNNHFKNIHIGMLISERLKEFPIEKSRICNFLKCDEKYLQEEIFGKESLSTDVLLRMSKLLEYDFFRVYSQHLILYSPPGVQNLKVQKNGSSSLPRFRKNIYTKELIAFVLEMIQTGEKDKNQVISEYGIPKTTLHKWISKHNSYEQRNSALSVPGRDE